MRKRYSSNILENTSAPSSDCGAVEVDSRKIETTRSSCVKIKTMLSHMVFTDVLNNRQKWMYSLFMSVFFIAIGGYWLIRPIKMGVFVALVGLEHEPMAKLGTVVILIPLLMIYGQVVSVINNPRILMYVVLSSYGVMFSIIAFGLSIPSIGIENKDASPRRIFGWIIYWTIESYGSITVAMLWSVLSSISQPDIAAVAYPPIVVASQLGAISGATLATYTGVFGFPLLFLLMTIFMVMSCALGGLAFTYIEANTQQRTSDSASSKPSSSNPQTGLFEGIRLILTKRYVMAIFIISTFSEIVGTIMDFQMKMEAKLEYPTPEDMASFMGRFGQGVNIVSLLFALTGTKFFLSRFGLRVCLTAFPATAMILIFFVFAYPNLWVLFSGMIVMKALGYSLNNPSKEILYLKTSKDVKFKAKSWTDMFGTRSAKAIGSLVNNSFRHSLSDLLMYGSMISWAFVGIWLVTARYLGYAHQRLSLTDEIVG